MKKQISDHEIPRSIHWLSIRLEARINTELENFGKELKKLDPENKQGSSLRKLKKMAEQLEPVLYIVEFHNKELAESIKVFLQE